MNSLIKMSASFGHIGNCVIHFQQSLRTTHIKASHFLLILTPVEDLQVSERHFHPLPLYKCSLEMSLRVS